jgi:hypothetical protein
MKESGTRRGSYGLGGTGSPRAQLLLFIAALSAMAAFTSANSSNTIQASLSVGCPFYISENALPIYTLGNYITLNYTIFTEAECTITDMPGSFVLQYLSNGVEVLSNALVTTATQTATLYNLPTINSLTLSPDNYAAIVSFSTSGSSGEDTRDFALVSPANIIVTDFTVSPSQVSVGLPVTFTVNLLNDGQLASDAIGVNLIITGPQSFDFNEIVSSLSPSQSEQASFVLSDVTGTAGSYTVSAFATFTSSSGVRQSNEMTATYSVSSPVTTSPVTPTPSPGPVPVAPVVALPQLEFTQVPFFSSLVLGSTLLSSIGIKNIIGVPETAILTIPQQLSSIFSLSAHSIYLVPNESLQVQLVFNSSSVNQSGVYVIPISIGLKALNGSQINSTQYMVYDVEKGSYNVSLYNQVYLSQSSATVTTMLVGARNTSLTNATLVTMLPSSVVGSATQIKTYGLPATVTPVSGGQNINWLVPYLPAGKTITLSYTITNPTNIGLLSYVQSLLTVPSQVTPASILRVVSLQAPTFYTNSTNRITVGALYTGTSQQKVRFTLTTTGAVEILNSVQLVNATPNQLLQQNFTVIVHNTTGTVLFELNIGTPNASVSYSLPVLVLARRLVAAQTTTTIPPTVISRSITKYAPLALGVAALIVIVMMVRGTRKRPRYNAEREKELIRIREQIKRGDEHA